MLEITERGDHGNIAGFGLKGSVQLQGFTRAELEQFTVDHLAAEDFLFGIADREEIRCLECSHGFKLKKFYDYWRRPAM